MVNYVLPCNVVSVESLQRQAHASVGKPRFPAPYDLVDRCGPRLEAARLMPCLRVCDAQLKFESDEVESRDVPIEFALRPKNDRHVAIKDTMSP